MAEAWPGCQCYDPGVQCCDEEARPDCQDGESGVYKCVKCGKRWTIHAEIRAVEVPTVPLVWPDDFDGAHSVAPKGMPAPAGEATSQ